MDLFNKCFLAISYVPDARDMKMNKIKSSTLQRCPPYWGDTHKPSF